MVDLLFYLLNLKKFICFICLLVVFCNIIFFCNLVCFIAVFNNYLFNGLFEIFCQHITYNEYLPIIIGPSNMAALSLLPSPLALLSYNSSVDAAVSNAFATAALRFGHSMVPTNLR